MTPPLPDAGLRTGCWRLVGRRGLPTSLACALASLAAAPMGAPLPGTAMLVAQEREASAGALDGAAPQHPLEPDSVYTLPDGPRIVTLPAPGSATVSLRLSIPVAEAPAEAGAGRLLQMLAVERARGKANPVGTEVTGTRTAKGVAYTVSGPVEEIDHLAWLLREVARGPSDEVWFGRARVRLIAEAREREETPSGRIVAELRRAIAPASPPLGGTTGTLEPLTLTDLRNVWERTHRPSAMTLVVAGDIPLELLLLSTVDLGATSDDAATLPTHDAPRLTPNPTEVIRSWYGEGHVLSGVDDPRGDVAALLVAEHFRSLDRSFETTVRLWEIDSRKALVTFGAAYARDRQAMRSTVRSALDATREELTPSDVFDAVARVRARVLFGARTPSGRAAFVGRHLEIAGEPTAGPTFLDALDGVTVESMRAFLAELADSPGLEAEIRP